ncbi:MAG: NAD-dependent epimerase/dehydratase family protein [Myxococcota bacterium]
MRILVTGGAGFIGSHLTDALIERGHDVVVLDSLVSGKRENLNPKARFVHADVRSDEASAAITEFAPEVVFHEAAQMDVRRSVEDPAYDADVNLVGLTRVAEAARKGGALQHILFAGSGGAMYGEQERYPALEDHRVRPESPYGLAKAVSEMYLDLFARLYGFRWTSLRYANVYGPRQDAHGEAGVVAIFCGRLLRGESMTIFGDGKQTRDYVFVRDVVAANLAALDHKLEGGFNVGTAKETDVNELAQRLIVIAGSHVTPSYAAARKGEQLRSVIDPGKLEAATGFRPNTSLDDGLRATFEWFAARQRG